MRKKIDEKFVEALKKAIDAAGSQSELARQSGVGQSTLNNFINPKKGRFFATDATLAKLMKFVEPFLSKDDVRKYGNVITSNFGTSVAVCGSHNNFFTPPASGGIDPELIKAAMQGMSPEEKARFLKELHK